MDKYLTNKPYWLGRIIELAWKGKFEKAQELIDFGIKKFGLTKLRHQCSLLVCKTVSGYRW